MITKQFIEAGKKTRFKKGQIPWNYAKTFKSCTTCGKDFRVPPSRFSVRTYCSPKCRSLGMSKRMSGKNHPLYKDGRKIYRKQAFEKYPKKCALCGSLNQLEVHHKDRDRKNNKIENLQIICISCHRRIHPKGYLTKRL